MNLYPEWMNDGTCAQTGIDDYTWFPDKGGSAKFARKICDLCPVRQLCLDYAVEHRLTHGIWGGTTNEERKHLYARTCVGCNVDLPESADCNTKYCASCRGLAKADRGIRHANAGQPGQVPCPHCGRRMRNDYGLAGHIARMHPDLPAGHTKRHRHHAENGKAAAPVNMATDEWRHTRKQARVVGTRIA